MELVPVQKLASHHNVDPTLPSQTTIATFSAADGHLKAVNQTRHLPVVANCSYAITATPPTKSLSHPQALHHHHYRLQRCPAAEATPLTETEKEKRSDEDYFLFIN